jgi:predicted PurR-regulated permease PerM
VWRFLGWAAVIAAALYFLYLVRASLIPFLIGGVIALLLNPFVDALCRRGYSRGRAILNVFLAFLLFTRWGWG